MLYGSYERNRTVVIFESLFFKINMIGSFASVFLWTVSFITMSISYGDYDEQLRSYYDNLYQRSSVKKQQSDGKSSEIVKLVMPGVHPTKVSSTFFKYPFYR